MTRGTNALSNPSLSNPYIAGAAAAVAVIAVAAAGWFAFGPRTPVTAPRAADATAAPAAARIAQHGRAVQDSAAGVTYRGVEETLTRPRQGYVVTFGTTDPRRLKARADADNAARQAAWQREFCSDELKQDMQERQVNVVTGRVVDGGGKTQYVADCVAGQGQPAQQMGPGGPLL